MAALVQAAWMLPSLTVPAHLWGTGDSLASFLQVHGVRAGGWLSGAPVLLTLQRSKCGVVSVCLGLVAGA